MSVNKTDMNYGEVISDVLSYISDESNFMLSNQFLNKKIVAVFRDEELMSTADSFFKSDLNISETSKNTFMHRNTLIYRIQKIHKVTGLNLRTVKDAVTFITLKAIYDKICNTK